MFGQIGGGNRYFVKSGKFYVYHFNKLMVFDIHSEQIRKLGHFERVSESFRMQDVEVLSDGNILMSATTGSKHLPDGRRSTMKSLYLLKNPE